MLYLTAGAKGRKQDWNGIANMLDREFGLCGQIDILDDGLAIGSLRDRGVLIEFADTPEGSWSFDMEFLEFVWMGKKGGMVRVRADAEGLLVQFDTANKSADRYHRWTMYRQQAWAVVQGYIWGLSAAK